MVFASSSKNSLLFGALIIIIVVTKGTLQGDCINERCCSSRVSTDYKSCSSMTLQECVKNDKYCIWNCDKEGDDLLYLGARGQGKFVGFSNGKGIIHDHNFDSKEDIQDIDPILKMNASEYAKYTSFQVFGKCGDIYQYTLPISVAQSRLNKIISGLYPKDVTVDYEYGKKLNLNEQEESVLDNDGLPRRRLGIFSPDGREKSTSKNIYPYRTNGKLISDSGGCSATLISKRVILTAAHCVYDTVNNDWITNKRFYPDATSSSDLVSSNEYIGYGMVWNNWIDTTCCTSTTCCVSSVQWDMALIRLSVANTGKGWMSYGYDTGLSAPQYLNTYGYPGDKPKGERWNQYCKYNKVNTNYFNSNECDIVGGQSGSSIYKYWKSSGRRVIYGIVYGGNSDQNYYNRITCSKYWDMCDFIDDGESSIC